MVDQLMPSGARVVPLGSKYQELSLLSTSHLGGANRAQVLQALADHGPLSRADLARLAGVTRGSIGGIVAGLLDEGILQERDGAATAGRMGKPSKPLWFVDDSVYGAVVVRPGYVDVGVVSSTGEIRRQDQARLPTGLGAREFDQEALSAVLNTLGDAGVGTFRAVGLALPAVFNAEGDLVASTTIPELVGSRLPALLAEALDVPVVLEDDARALALGLRWFGQARGVKDFAALQIGEGIGAGIMLDGRLRRGRSMVSEIGHMTVDFKGARCRCGLHGCWETIASLRWLRSSAEMIGLGDAQSITPGRLASLSQHGDARATALIDDYADHVAVGIVNLFHSFSVPRFILEGEVVDAGERFLQRLRFHVDARTMPALSTRPEIAFVERGTSPGLLGAAAAAVTFTLGVNL